MAPESIEFGIEEFRQSRDQVHVLVNRIAEGFIVRVVDSESNVFDTTYTFDEEDYLSYRNPAVSGNTRIETRAVVYASHVWMSWAYANNYRRYGNKALGRHNLVQHSGGVYSLEPVVDHGIRLRNSEMVVQPVSEAQWSRMRNDFSTI